MQRFLVRSFALLTTLAALLATWPAEAQTGQPVEATNAAGDKILLYPDGRWEYADPAKRATMPKPADDVRGAAAARNVAPGAAPGAAAPETAGREAGPTQGGWLFGRRIPAGDPDYDRRSLNPKLR